MKLNRVNKTFFFAILLLGCINMQLWVFDGFLLKWFLWFVAGLILFYTLGFVVNKFLINRRIKKWWRYPETYCKLVYHKYIVWNKYIIIFFKSEKEPSFYKSYVWKNNETGKYRLDWWKQYPATGWRNPRDSSDIRLLLDGWDADTIKNLFTKLKDWFENLDLGYRIRNVRDWLLESKRWLYFVLPVVLFVIAYVIGSSDKFDIDSKKYDLSGICYVPGNPETIWECYFIPSSFDDTQKGAYKIIVKNARTGEEIKTIKETFDKAEHSFEIVYSNNRVWILGYDLDKPPVIEAYNPSTYDKILDIETIKSQYPELKQGIIDGQFFYDTKAHDSQLSIFKDIPKHEIVEMVGADGNKRYYNIGKAELYSDKNELYWNYGISNNRMAENSGDYIYYLVYRNDRNKSYLYRWKPKSKNAIISSSDPHQIDSLLNNGFIDIELEKTNYIEAFEKAKIVFQDSMLICVLHTTHLSGETIHQITCLNNSGENIGDIHLSMFTKYHLQQIDELFISAYRKDNIVTFRVEGLGEVSLDLINKTIQFNNDVHSYPFILVETSNYSQKYLYVNLASCIDLQYASFGQEDKFFKQLREKNVLKHLIPETVLMYPGILYQNESLAIIYYYKPKSNNGNECEILCVDKQGNVLHKIPQTQWPHNNKIKEEINGYHGTNYLEDNLSATMSGSSLVVIFKRLGAICIDIKTKKVLWKYEVAIS